MKLIVSVPCQYGSPVLKCLSPQLVSVQSAKRFFLFAFRIPGQHHGPKLRKSPLRFRKRPALVFSELFLFASLLKHQGHLPLHAFSLVGPYESILEPQLIRAHWRIIRQSSTPLVSSQTSRCPTHAPTAEPFRPTVVILPPLRTIRHCKCKATVSCLGSDLVHSSSQTIICLV
ncbi:UNVERIFIED_CONTAM: hypothetical protein NCL1_27023 [Trichonephila clavipes]